jgi:hypothetical protein
MFGVTFVNWFNFFLISISRNHKNNLIINNSITLLKNIIKLNKNISDYKQPFNSNKILL